MGENFPRQNRFSLAVNSKGLPHRGHGLSSLMENVGVAHQGFVALGVARFRAATFFRSRLGVRRSWLT